MDRDDFNKPSGLYGKPVDVENSRQLIGYHFLTMAIHSKSQGWIPMVKVSFDHTTLEPSLDKQSIEFLMKVADINRFILELEYARDRAKEDAAVAFGDIPHG
jgi:hypothetical protein